MNVATWGICATLVLGVATPASLHSMQAAAHDQSPGALLHDRAAKARHRLVEPLDPGDLPAADLGQLAGRSPVVVVGRTLASRARLTSDDRDLVTEVGLLVQQSVKGALRPGAVVYFQVPGGAHRFEDGDTVAQFTPGFLMPRAGACYLVFLRALPPRDVQPAARVEGRPYRAQFELAAGLQGVFELDFARGVVVPSAFGPTHPLASRYNGMSATQFLNELRRAGPR